MVRAESQCSSGSIYREVSFLSASQSCVRLREVTAVTIFYWLAFVKKWFSGFLCWWVRNHMVSVAHIGEKAVFGSRVSGTDVTAFWWFSSARTRCLGVIRGVLAGAMGMSRPCGYLVR